MANSVQLSQKQGTDCIGIFFCRHADNFCKICRSEEIDVILYEDQKELDEVVVTGYQVLDKRTQTSAITTVKAEDIMIPGVTSIDQMLEGRIPEMTFMLNSGEVGATPRLRVRGTSTLWKPGASVGIGRYRDDRPCRCRSRRFE